MNKATTSYQRAVCKHLRCGRTARRRLAEQLSGLLNAFEAENPAPDRAALAAAFGAPEELAATLMEELTPEEQNHWKKHKLAARVILVALAALLAVFSIYTFFIKEKPVEITTYEFSYINGDSGSSAPSADESQE